MYCVAPIDALQLTTIALVNAVALTFAGTAGAIDCVVTEISAAAELPPPL
jgi:hypothetical protein